HEPAMEVRGRDMISGLPRKTQISSAEIREALQEPVTQIIEAVTRTLELAEPELAADLVENGITMAGGSSKLRGLTSVISNANVLPRIQSSLSAADGVQRHFGVFYSGSIHQSFPWAGGWVVLAGRDAAAPTCGKHFGAIWF